MIKHIIKALVLLRNYLVYKKFVLLAACTNRPFILDTNAEFVVSIASYPKRDHLLPAVFEALSKQTVKPQKWILVLSDEDYPDRKLPKHLNKLTIKGIEIIWVKNNPFAVKKLLPVLKSYPDYDVITLDDDIIYHPNLVKGLVEFTLYHTDCIVGYVGKAMLRRDRNLNMFYREFNPANLSTPSEQVYLIGWGGIYYPSNSLDKRVLEMDAVHRIVPGRGSDIWFWAAAHSNETKQICLGLPENYNLGIPIPQTKHTAAKDQPEKDVLLNRFQMAIDFFGIREKLLKSLPDHKA